MENADMQVIQMHPASGVTLDNMNFRDLQLRSDT